MAKYKKTEDNEKRFSRLEKVHMQDEKDDEEQVSRRLAVLA